MGIITGIQIQDFPLQATSHARSVLSG